MLQMLAPSKLIPTPHPSDDDDNDDDDDDEPDYLNHEPEERCKFSRRDQCEPDDGRSNGDTAMGRRLNWERANLNRKPKQSLADEREFMERDHAARWLERRQDRLTKAAQSRGRRRSRKAAQSRVAPSIARRRQQSNAPLPWEGESEFDEGQNNCKEASTMRTTPVRRQQQRPSPNEVR